MTMNWVGWIVSGVVLLLLFAVGAILKNPVRLLITGERTEGIVVGMAKSGSLQAPIFEFVTSTGERVSAEGRSYSAWNSARVGDTFTVAYDPSHPKNAQLLSLGQFPLGIAGILLGFAAFIILIWISRILAGDSTFDDPLHLLPAVISHFRLLRAKGVDVNAKDKDGRTQLHLAADSGEQEVARLLLAKGADVNAKDTDGQTPAELSGVSGK